MSNSIIINFIENSTYALKRSYKNSLLYFTFLRSSYTISLIVKECFFMSAIAKNQSFNRQWDNSMINSGIFFISTPFRSLRTKCSNIKDSTSKTSVIWALTEGIYSKLVILDSRFIGSIITGFFITVLAFSARWGFGGIKFKIICAILFFASLFLFLINMSLLAIYKSSFFNKTVNRIMKFN